jgi:hypothetical protein
MAQRRDARGRFAGGGGSSAGGGGKRKFKNQTRAKNASKMTFKGRDSEGMAVMGTQKRAKTYRIPKPSR